MLSVLDPIHGHVGGFEDSFLDAEERWTRGRTYDGVVRGRARRGGRQKSPPTPPPPQQLQPLVQLRKSPKVSAAPRGAVGRSLEDIVEFSSSSPTWQAEIELARQRADVLRSSSQLVESEVAALERNREAHRRLHAELLAVFDAIFAEADAVFERHKRHLEEEAVELRKREEDLNYRLAHLTKSTECDDTSLKFVRSYEQLMELLREIAPRKSVPCHGAFGEDFQQAVKSRLAWRSSDVLLRDFRQQQSTACRVFPCLLNLLAEVRSELLLDPAATLPPDEATDEAARDTNSSSSSKLCSTHRLDTGGVRLTDLAVVRPQQTLFFKPKFGVKRQRGWFGWSALPDTVLYGACPGDNGSQLLVLSKTGQYLTGMRLSFESCSAAGAQASRFDALHFSQRAQLLFLSDAPNNRVLVADLCGSCRMQLSGLNQPRGAHHDDLNERLFVINSGSGTLEVFACPIYLQQQQAQQQLPRLGKCVQLSGLSRVSAVATSLRCLYVTDCQLARLHVFANQLGFPALSTVDLLPAAGPGVGATLPPLFVYFSAVSASPIDASEPELQTAKLTVATRCPDKSWLANRQLYSANEAGTAFSPEELTVYFCHPSEACIFAVRLL